MSVSILTHGIPLRDHYLHTSKPHAHVMFSPVQTYFAAASDDACPDVQPASPSAPSAPAAPPDSPLMSQTSSSPSSQRRYSSVRFDEDPVSSTTDETTAAPINKLSTYSVKMDSASGATSAGRFAESAGPGTKAAEPRQENKEERELTAVDRKWGCLFDKSSQPTKRFQEFMRSLYQYIVSYFLPFLSSFSKPVVSD